MSSSKKWIYEYFNIYYRALNFKKPAMYMCMHFYSLHCLLWMLKTLWQNHLVWKSIQWHIWNWRNALTNTHTHTDTHAHTDTHTRTHSHTVAFKLLQTGGLTPSICSPHTPAHLCAGSECAVTVWPRDHNPMADIPLLISLPSLYLNANWKHVCAMKVLWAACV